MVFHVTPPPAATGPETAQLTDWLYRLAEYLNVYLNSGSAATPSPPVNNEENE